MANPAFISSLATSGDAVAARALNDLKVFTDWLGANNQLGKGLIGEVGIPSSSRAGTDPVGSTAQYNPGWESVLEQWFTYANQQRLNVTMWTASEWNIDLRVYRTDDGANKTFNYRTTASSVLENNLSTVNYLRGVNLAGAEYSDAGPNGGLNMSTITQPGAGYYYPTLGDWAVLYARGVRLVRLPVRWERLQRTLLGALDTTELNLIKGAIQAANAAGIKILLDQHNYGRYDTAANGNTSYSSNGAYNLGQNAPSSHNGTAVGGTMLHCFIDFWNRVATAFKNTNGLWGYGLTNEPHDLTGGVAMWQEASRQATEAIRLIDQTVYISIAGYLYSSVPFWTQTNGSTAWLTQTIPSGQTNAGQPRNLDPKIVWEGHHYFDNDHSGTYTSSYASEVSDAQNAGFTSYSTNGYTPPATNNSFQTGPRTVFQSSMDSSSDFTVSQSTNTVGSNTVTLPCAAVGNPGNSLRIVTTNTSDEGGVRKSLTAAEGKNVRTLSFEMLLPSNASVSTAAGSSFTFLHAWDNTYTNDLIEIRFLGRSSGYIVGLTVPTGSYTFSTAANPTILSRGTWHTITLSVTDNSFQLFVDGAATSEVSISAANTNTNIGGFALGKFYGTSYVGTLYFDNIIGSMNAGYYAPPNGGALSNTASTAPGDTVGTSQTGLLPHFF